MSKSFNDLWLTLLEMKPFAADLDTVLEIKSKHLKDLLQQFYNIGRRHGKESVPDNSVFGQMFGRTVK